MRCVNLLSMCVVIALMQACSAVDQVSSEAESSSTPKPTAPAPVPKAELRKAEYSLRWTPVKSLATADDVVNWLRAQARLSADAKAEPGVDIRYFTPANSTSGPPAVRSILRQRGDDSWTYKVRGIHGAVPPREAALVGCEDAAIEGEWDISVDPLVSFAKPTASLSCDGEGTSDKPGNLKSLESTKSRPCAIRMERTRIPWDDRKDVKIEHWTFRPSPTAPAIELLEVSWKGKAKPEDEAAFRQLIHGMPIGGGVRPPSKEELAEACDALSVSTSTKQESRKGASHEPF